MSDYETIHITHDWPTNQVYVWSEPIDDGWHNSEKLFPWTCDNCRRPTDLSLVAVSLRTNAQRFRSACCRATVTQTKELTK